MLGQPRIDQRRLGLVQRDAGVRIDHRSNLGEIRARQRDIRRSPDLVRDSLLVNGWHAHAASLSECGKTASSSIRQIIRPSMARMPRAKVRSNPTTMSGVG